jgi:hypothetical protein
VVVGKVTTEGAMVDGIFLAGIIAVFIASLTGGKRAWIRALKSTAVSCV